MFALSLRLLAARRRRLAGAFTSVLIGVAFLTGTLVVGDTLRNSFDDLLRGAVSGTDVVVRSPSPLGGSSDVPPALDANVLDAVRRVPGVAVAEPVVTGYGRIIAPSGEPVGGDGPPTLAGSWTRDEALNPYELVAGRAPLAPGEVVLNRGAARDAGIGVGDTVTVQTPDPVRVTVVGIATFGGADGFGPTTFAAFTVEEAQRRLLGDTGKLSTVSVRAESGVGEAELQRRLRAALPREVEVVTGTALADENVEAIGDDFLDTFAGLLVGFAAIALLVAAFAIHNTFGVVLAQRTREAALLRAVGATRRQLLATTLAESLSVGLAGAAAGVPAGVGIAVLLQRAFTALGFPLPQGPLVVSSTAVVLPIVVGTAVTVFAGASPAVRAGRVAPLAALRDPEPAASRRPVGRTAAAAVLLVAAGALAVTVPETGSTSRGMLAAVAVLLATALAGPALAGPVTRVLGAPLPRLRGVPGVLARRNAARNPRRTAGASLALTVGVGVVTLFTIFVASLAGSVDDDVTDAVRSDLVVRTGNFDGGASPALAGRLAELPGVRAATGLGIGRTLVGGTLTFVTVADPAALPGLLDLPERSGDVSRLRAGEVALSVSRAGALGVGAGDAIDVTFPDGKQLPMRVAAIYPANDVAGELIVPRATWSRHEAGPTLDRLVLVDLADPGALPAVERTAREFGATEVSSPADYAASIAERLAAVLNLGYVLLVLAIVIAVAGIANTVSLAMYERTREIGLLRAVGGTAGQVRSAVRWESALVAAYGAAAGLALGVLLGAVLLPALAPGIGGVVVPPARLAAIGVAGAAAGLLAAARPARRAARADLLAAVAAE